MTGSLGVIATLSISGQTQVIYDMPQVVYVRYPANTMFSRDLLNNYSMRRADFRLVQGVTNEVYVYIADLEMMAIASGTFIISFTDDEVILSKPLTLHDSSKGRWLLTLTPDDVATLPLGTVRWSIVFANMAGVVLLWTDLDTTYSYARISENPIPPAVAKVLVWDDFFQLTDGVYYSSSLIGAGQQSYVGGTQSFTVTMRNFTGRMRIDATLSAQPNTSASAEDWFEVDRADYTAFTGDDLRTIQGNYTWVRMAVIRSDGSLDQVQYTV